MIVRRKRDPKACALCGETPTKREMVVYSLQDLLNEPPRKNGEAISLLCEAIRCLQRDYEGAAWRVADALFLIGQKWPQAHGIAEPTGRGASLQVKAK